MHTVFTLSTTISALYLAMGFAPAIAQQNPDNTENNRKLETSIEKIIVSSERRTESTQEMSVAISTVTGKDLLANGSSDLVSAIVLMPSVEQQQSNRSGGFYVRGIGSRFPGVDTSVATYSDNVFQSRGEVTNFSFVDVERIEVLRGPQGTLYGRNSIGGAVNIISKNPELGENNGSVNVQVGNYGAYHVEGVANVALNESTALRAVVVKDKHDGYLDSGLNDADTSAGRIKLLTEPNENVSLLLGIEYFKNGGLGIGNGVFNTGFKGLSFTEEGNTIGGCGEGTDRLCIPFTDTKNINIYAELDINLDWATLSFLPSYQDFSSVYTQIFGTILEDSDTPFKQKTMEVRLVSNDDGDLEWVTGLYWYKGDASGQIVDNALFGAETVGIDINKSSAVYAQATYSLSETLRLIGGLRYTKDQFDLDTLVNYVDRSETLAASEEYSKTTYKAGLEYDIAAESLLYASVSTGFKQGGSTISGSTGTIFSWKPETIIAYELGSKNRFNDGTLQLNLAAFYYNWKNYVADAPVFTDFEGETVIEVVKQNIPSTTTLFGLELEGIWLLSDNDRLQFSVTKEKSEFGDASFDGEELGGRELNHAPSDTASLGYNHTWELANNSIVVANFDAKYNSGYWLDLHRSGDDGAGQPWFTAKQAPYVLFNASLRYEPQDTNWWLSLYVKNITNEVVHNQANPGGPPPTPLMAVVGAPRTFGISATYQF